MAKNGPIGKGREGMVDNRSQTYNPTNNLWVKRDSSTGKFMDAKTSGGKFKGVKTEKNN